jgi:hypothetical protein
MKLSQTVSNHRNVGYFDVINKGYNQGIYAPAHSQILHLFQFASEM